MTRQAHPSGIELDRCPSCGGVYLDAGELEKIEDSRDEKRPARDVAFELFRRSHAAARRPDTTGESERELRECPRCQAPMFEREWGKTFVMVDVCLDCRGVWLDASELETLESTF